jgi:hypothetical protein
VSSDLAASPVFLAATAAVALGALVLSAAIVALARGRLFLFAKRTLAGLLLLSLGALAGALFVGTQGYRELTREDLAARLFLRPTGPQRFSATVRFPDGHERTYDLAGDEIYVDAHILKWKPFANALGLHTAYELDRVEAAITQSRKNVQPSARCIHSANTVLSTFSRCAGAMPFSRRCSMPSTARPRLPRFPRQPSSRCVSPRQACSSVKPWRPVAERPNPRRTSCSRSHPVTPVLAVGGEDPQGSRNAGAGGGVTITAGVRSGFDKDRCQFSAPDRHPIRLPSDSARHRRN